MFDHPAFMAAAAETVAARIAGDLPAEGHTYTRSIANVVKSLAVSAEALARVVDNPNPTETQAAIQKRVGAAAKGFGDLVARAKDNLHNIMRNGLKDIEDRARTKTGLKADSFAGEIRASIRAMSLEDKLALLNDLAKQGRGSDLAAVIDAPPLLSGLTPEAQQRAKDALEEYHAPAEKREREALLAAFGQAFDMASACASTAAHMGDPRKLAEIEQGEAAAAAALEAFQASTRG